MHTMWPSLSHKNPDPVPSTLAFSSSFAAICLELFLGSVNISRSLMKTTEGEASYKIRSQWIFYKQKPPKKINNVQRCPCLDGKWQLKWVQVLSTNKSNIDCRSIMFHTICLRNKQYGLIWEGNPAFESFVAYPAQWAWHIGPEN